MLLCRKNIKIVLNFVFKTVRKVFDDVIAKMKNMTAKHKRKRG